MKTKASLSDRRLVLSLAGVLLLLIVAVAIIAPAANGNDTRPTTTNANPSGAKAAFLLMQELGRKPQRWTKALEDLDMNDAAGETLVLAEPQYEELDHTELKSAIKEFLNHGGRVLATDRTGAALLPDGAVESPSSRQEDDCHTTPSGPGELARAGDVTMENHGHWSTDGPQYRVEQLCGNDAVVVRYAVGKGEAIWWSSATPLTNAGLKEDASLRLFLASVGDGRAVLFDESLHGAMGDYWNRAQGLPLNWLKAQVVLLAVLLVLSFSRRRGPVRPMVTIPRTSPVEFASSMGALYERAGTTSAATDAAQRRLLRVVTLEAGVPQAAVQDGPAAVAEALGQRLGGEWDLLRAHLEEALRSQGEDVSPRSALALVKALSADADDVRKKLRPNGAAVAVEAS